MKEFNNFSKDEKLRAIAYESMELEEMLTNLINDFSTKHNVVIKGELVTTLFGREDSNRFEPCYGFNLKLFKQDE